MKDKTIVVEITTYEYYDPRVSMMFYDKEWKNRVFKGKKVLVEDDDYEYNKKEIIIENRHDLVFALKEITKCQDIDFPRCKINDLIRLLDDNNLGDEFYENVIRNCYWTSGFWKKDVPVGDYSLDFYILDNKNITYWVKNQKDFEELVLDYFLENHIEFDEEDFTVLNDIKEKKQEFDNKEALKIIADKKRKLEKLINDIEALKDEIHELEEKVGVDA